MYTYCSFVTTIPSLSCLMLLTMLAMSTVWLFSSTCLAMSMTTSVPLQLSPSLEQSEVDSEWVSNDKLPAVDE